MTLGSGLPVPASLELMARCAVAARRRSWRSSASREPEASPRAAHDPREIASLLERLGIRRGDTLMVHSSATAVEQLGLSPSDLIDFLIDYLGPEGTLAMPTHPKLTREGSFEVYDVRRSSSRVGLVTELFRRRPQSRRSRYPLSAAAALGVRAEELTSSHARSWAPHDEQSPYAKLAELDGKALCIGCSLDRLTILHVAEDVLRDALPIRDFHVEREVLVRDGNAETRVVAHERAPWLWWYLNLGRWNYEMRRRSLARESQLHGVPFRAAAARPTVEWMKSEIRAGRSIYPLAWANRWLRLGNPHEEAVPA